MYKILCHIVAVDLHNVGETGHSYGKRQEEHKESISKRTLIRAERK